MSEAYKLDWKTYESITKYIYENLGRQSGVKVKGHGQNCKVVGKSTVSHQIDVLTTHSDGIHNYYTAIECKYWKEKVNKDIVMKVASIIEDAGISKGVIVTKNGFTQDGLEYAKFKNIGLVELREPTTKDGEFTAKEIEFGNIDIKINATITSPKISTIDIGNNRFLEVENEFDLFNYFIILKNGTQVAFYDYVANFRMEVANQDIMGKEITKSYKIPESRLCKRQTDKTFELDEVTFTGQLTQRNESRNLTFTLVDKVWLIMKSIFDNRRFSFSENGIIVEHSNQ
ncbi:restriction endonuclease [Flavobacterium sp. SUN052]|uniref:restriction endonuclease n=1 Tax=Flavobacterium sp. SUN052 TaxID=3002441 RepID=UPI00237E04A7|nr:restriction endonuclease [Flavobacterium sp. SUN052]MEC4004830.1 restriction endonuclease [Flavobacterium sp. SUN052]